MPTIVTRSQWGFNGWLDPKDPPNTVNEKTQRTEFFTHYNGPPTGLKAGTAAIVRGIHAFHKSKGWKGIAYGHIVFADGSIYEGRGFNLQGSHCPDHNVSGYSAMAYCGDGEKPTAAMLSSIRWLYEEAQRRAGRTLAKKGHRDGIATKCPGDALYGWVRNGMPASTATPTTPEDDMPTTQEVVDGIMAAKVIPANMLVDGWKAGDPVNLVAIPRALDLVMRWALDARDNAIVARTVAEAQAQLGRPMTATEVSAAVKSALSEAATIEVVVKKEPTP